ncbi:MAG: hypothetical protein MJA83_13925, partial [Gammaproteobacteria bacterium]|nr:hypothetical protein [Gammaproteobacteria bacterium]
MVDFSKLCEDSSLPKEYPTIKGVRFRGRWEDGNWIWDESREVTLKYDIRKSTHDDKFWIYL